MLGAPTGLQTPPLDSSRSALDFVHRLLILPADEHANLEGLLDELANAFSDSEAALLALAGQALMPRFVRDETPTPWAVQLDRSIRRQRMDAAVRLVRRLSHDFGNILTGILGFSELALAHPAACNSPLHDFLSEIHRGAQSGTQYTNRLRLFARRHTVGNRCCSFVNVLAELNREGPATNGERADSSSFAMRNSSPVNCSDVRLQINAPDDLPSVAVSAEALQQVLAIVLENAREAIVSAGVIDISTRTIQVHAGEAGKLFGDLRPGTHLEICIADTGSGLTSEAQRQLFSEPFFSTKPRKHGFGLAIAYSILAAHRGGIELLSRPEGGTIARLLLPVAAVAAATS